MWVENIFKFGYLRVSNDMYKSCDFNNIGLVRREEN